MDVRVIEYFLQVYKQKNISKAATELYISQQGLSKAIRALEMELGVHLFERTKTGVEPTEFADRIYAYAQNIYSNHQQMVNSIDELRDLQSGAIRLGLVNGAISALPISQLIFEFTQQYPGIQVHPTIESDYACENLLIENKLDMAVLVMPVESPNIRHSLIAKYPSCICVSKDDELAKKEIVTLFDLANRPIITIDERFKMNNVLRESASRYGIKLEEAFHSTQLYDLIDLAKNKLGVAIFSKLWLMHEQFDDEIHIAEIADPDLAMSFCLGYNTKKIRSPNEKLFFDFLYKSLCHN